MNTAVDRALVVRLEASLAKFERQMAKARGVGRDTATGIQGDFNRMNNQLAGSSARAARGLGGFVNVSRGGRFVLQNTAAQIGDIAVQLEQGTAASRVASQQLPQLFGGFAALGGSLGLVLPLLGTLAAIGIPIGAALLNMSRSTNAAEDNVRSFTDRLSEAEAAINRAADAAANAGTGGLQEIQDRFGEVTNEIQRMLNELAQIEREGAQIEVSGLLGEALGAGFTSELDRLFGQVGSAIVGATNQDIEASRALIAELEGELQNLITLGQGDGFAAGQIRQDLVSAREEFAALSGDFESLGSLSEGLVSPNLLQRVFDLRTALGEAIEEQRFADAVVQIDRLRTGIGVAADEAGGMTPPLEEALNALTRAQAVVQEFANDMGQLAEESGKASQESMTLEAALANIAGSDISGVAEQATLIAERLGMAANEAARFISTWSQVASLGGAPSSGVVGFEASDPRNPNAPRPIFDGPTQTVTNFTMPTASGGGGRGGGGGGGAQAVEMTEAMRVAAQVLREVRTEMVTLEQVQGELTAALDDGEISAEMYASAMDVVRDRFAEANGALASMGELLADIAVNWESAGDIAVSALRRITQQLLSRAFTQGLERLAQGPAGGVLTTIAGGLFGAGLGRRASGGGVRAGVPYLVNENTPRPEVMVPSTNGAVLNVAQAQAALAGGSSGGPAPVTVNFTNQIEGAQVQHTGSQIGQDGRRTESFVLSLMRRAVGDGQLDGALGTRFQLSPRPVRQ